MEKGDEGDKRNPEQRKRDVTRELAVAIETLFAQKQNAPLHVIDICEFITGVSDSETLQVFAAFMRELKFYGFVKEMSTDVYILDVEGLDSVTMDSITYTIRLPLPPDFIGKYGFSVAVVEGILQKYRDRKNNN